MLNDLMLGLFSEDDFWEKFTAVEGGEDREGDCLRLERKGALPVIVRVNDEGFSIKNGDHKPVWCALSTQAALDVIMGRPST